MWGTSFIHVLHEPSATVLGSRACVSACHAFPDSGVESWCSLGRGSGCERLIGSLKDAAT